MRFLVHALILLASPLAMAGRNVLLIIADDYGVDSSSLYNTTAGATARLRPGAETPPNTRS
ncbi:MAG: hypothetical protein CFE26_18355 [Verrucomicrobiales bacterium VVV1]|nr:MAG: hypothetical protein CFE26_18355 [Verrucomicrobiales bacterium VVV1]